MTILRRLFRSLPVAAATLGVVGVLTGFVLAIWFAPRLIAQDVLRDTRVTAADRQKAVHDARLMVISLGGALVVVTGLLYTARNYRLAHRGQITDRYTKALERLGSEELYVRIGGVHALEHVMRDSPEFHDDVVEVLVSFIRDRAPRRVDPIDTNENWMHPPIGSDSPDLPIEPAPDVQAALTTLGRHPRQIVDVRRVLYARRSLDFHDLHLEGARLYAASLQGADLAGANFQDAELGRVNLQGANLRRVNLQGASLFEANLLNTRLGGANLQDTRLYAANLQDTSLFDTNLQGARLYDANLQGARLGGANLQDTYLNGANLQGANLSGANLQDTYLNRANLQGADLSGAKLQGADLSGAKLQGADLSGAKLQGADLSGANLQWIHREQTYLSPEQLKMAVVTARTDLTQDG